MKIMLVTSLGSQKRRTLTTIVSNSGSERVERILKKLAHLGPTHHLYRWIILPRLTFVLLVVYCLDLLS